MNIRGPYIYIESLFVFKQKREGYKTKTQTFQLVFFFREKSFASKFYCYSNLL